MFTCTKFIMHSVNVYVLHNDLYSVTMFYLVGQVKKEL